MFLSARRSASAAAIAIGALGALALAAPAAHANITRPTGYVWTGPNALANCRAMGLWEVANNDWDGFGCHNDFTVAPDAIRLWVIIAT
jgi:hypothetical protein